jgi:hypothetical protein
VACAPLTSAPEIAKDVSTQKDDVKLVNPSESI